jgi:hypothetical protein
MSGTVSDNISQSSGSVTEAAGGVSIVSSDPTLTEGLLWYNSTSNVLKVARNIAAWSAGGNLNTGRSGSTGSNGTQSACFVAGGNISGGRTLSSETYNGSAWSAVGNLIGTARGGTSNFGTNTAGASCGGYGTSTLDVTNEFDGTSWTDASATLIQGGIEAGACGTQTAGLKVGAYEAAGDTFFDECEEYDGSSWAAGGLISADTYAAQACGTQTSAIRGGGSVAGTGVATSQTYNGTSWSAVASLSTARRSPGMFGASDSDGNLSGGRGASASIDSTELWNGSSWAAGSTRGNALKELQGAGSSSSSGLTAGGDSNSVVTEEYSETLTARTLSNS